MEIQKEPLETYYDVCEDIGKGQFATVKRCIHKETQAEYAAKFIRKRRGGGRRGAKMEDIQKEIDILSSVSHRSIIRLYEVYETNREVILLLELVSGGELFEYLSEKDKLSEEEASAFIKQILDGVLHLHSKNIAHLDLKPENILLQDKNSTHVKLIDFGLSRKILPNEDHRALMGTAEFVAPEVVSFEQLTLATDMWSIGVITYILLSGASPFLGDNQQETYHNITAVNFEFDEEYFNGTSEMAKGFIRSLLVKDKRKRANIHDCLNHPWIKPVEKKQRDLRRSSIIKTEHLKKFIARQRWKRSMRVVSLCNRLSRSLQLRRIQSTDTLGSCNEEVCCRQLKEDLLEKEKLLKKKKHEERLKMKVHVSLSAPVGSEDMRDDDDDDDNNDNVDDVTPVTESQPMDDVVAALIAKKIIEDVMKRVSEQLESKEKEQHPSNDTNDVLMDDPDQLRGSDVQNSLPSLSAEAEPEQNAQSNFDVAQNNHDSVEVFVEQSEDISPNDAVGEVDVESLLSPTSPKRRLSRSKRKLSDLHDITEEDIPKLLNVYGAAHVMDSDKSEPKSDLTDDITKMDKESEDNSLCLDQNSMASKSVNTETCHVFVAKERKASTQTETDNNESIGTPHNVPEGLYFNFDNDSQFQQEIHNTEDNATQDTTCSTFVNGSGGDISIESISDRNEIVGKQVLDAIIHDVIQKSINIVEKQKAKENAALSFETPSETDYDRTIRMDEYIAESCNAVTANEHTDSGIESLTAATIQSDKDSEKSFEELNSTDSEEARISDNEFITQYIDSVIERAKQELMKVDTHKVQIIITKPEKASVMRSLKDYPGLKDNESEMEMPAKANNVLTPFIQYDPLHIASFDESGQFHTTRDLFDIPEELEDDIQNGGLQQSINEELKRKILRQRERKLSLQRRVHAKMVQDTLYNELTKFTELRDEKRIESFEMQVLKSW